MPTLNDAELFQSAAAATAALRLVFTGLARRQPALLSFLCVTSLSCLALSLLPAASGDYFRVFLFCTSLTWLVSVLTVSETFTLALSSYPGIRTAARWTMYSSLTLSVVVSLALTVSRWQRGPHGDLNLYYVQLADRVIVFTLAAIIAGLLFFLSRYPLHLSRNTYISCGFFSVVFLTQAVADMIDSFDSRLYSIPFDTAEVLIGGVLFLAWAFLLQGEAVSSAPRPNLDAEPERDLMLLRQLDSMNRLLSRLGRH